MARRSGINGVILADVSSTAGGTLTTVSYFTKWSVNMTRSTIDVTSLGDTTKTYVVDLPDQSVQLDGISNLGTDLVRILTDGKARGLTIIPDNTNNTAVTFSGGTYYFSGTVSGGVGESVNFTMTAVPASSGSWATGV